MKIGTDSVLTGVMTVVNDAVKTILDIGTGTGLLALMLAQKSTAYIDAVEIDEEAFKQASENFSLSKWSNRLNAHFCSLQMFKKGEQFAYDLIISNPPYFRFKKNILISDKQRSNARHDKELSFEDLAYQVKRLLKPDGNFWVILPVQEAVEFIKIASNEMLFVSNQILVQAKPGKLPNRIIMCFTGIETPVKQNYFCILNEEGKPSTAYYEATKDYLLWLNFN
ncbi:MAG: methyltransferase [Bacteroidia bacterium]|nr:methyltransferase [Bacteroidia bacterium]